MVKILSLFLLLLVLSTSCTYKKTKVQSNYVLYFFGNVSITDSAGNERTAQIKSEINDGETIATGEDAVMTIQFESGLIKVRENTTLRFNVAEKNGTKKWNLTLEKGAIFSNLHKLSSGEAYTITSSGAVATVHGTQFLAAHDEKSGRTEIFVAEGVVRVANTLSQEVLDLKADQRAVVIANIIEIKENDDITKLLLTMLGLEKMLENPSIHETAFFFSENRKRYEEKEKFYKNKIKLITLYKEIPAFINYMEKRKIKKQIDAYSPASSNFDYIHGRLQLYHKMKRMTPVQRLKALGTSPVQKFSLTDGSQLIGMVISQDASVIQLDTGSGVLTLPKIDIVQRFDVK